MKVVIVAPKDIEYSVVCAAIDKSGFKISELCLGIGSGVDIVGEQWAEENDISFKLFPVEWKNLKQPGAVPKEGKYGKYNTNAAKYRDNEMCKHADALIAIEGAMAIGLNIKMHKDAENEVFKYDPEEFMTDEEYGHIF